MLGRRNFLRMAAVSPIAGPVAAKEAAAAMGLSGPLSAAGAMLPGTMLGGASAKEIAPSGSYLDFLRGQLAEIMSGKRNKDIEREALYTASRLDADLACMRSVSPAFAWQAQRSRNYSRIMAERKEHLLQQIASHSKNALGL